MGKSILPALVLLGCSAIPALAGGGGADGDWELGVYVGFGDPDSYDPLDPGDDVLYGVRVGYFLTPRWSVEGSYQGLSAEGDVGGRRTDVDLDALRLNLLFNFSPEKDFRWFLTAGLGNESTDARGVSETDLGWNAGGGARWYFGSERRFAFRADVRWIEVDVGGDVGGVQNNREATGGFVWSFGGGPVPDSDGDQVPDRKDKCARSPRGALVDASGCPLDADGDGVFDGLDRCPETPRAWAVDRAGCPQDADGDGVPDMADRCPGTPKEAKVDTEGCPTEDADGDGVWNGDDRCPGTPRGVKVDPAGCPMDGDGDGVWDGEDQCPGSPRGSKVDSTGCPVAESARSGSPPAPSPAAVASPVLPEARKALVLEGVTFAGGSASLTPESQAILDRVAASLRENPDVRIEIGGHTDSAGESGRNRQLSLARAESVRGYLVSRGVPPGQLTVKGYGSSRPIADNGTEAGRALNRRVELSRLP
jgi:OOP family OmpA-OmpF porin